MSKESNLLAGLIIGLAGGVVAGLLLAPNSGKETRNYLKQKSSDLKNNIDKKLASLDTDTLSDLKEKFSDVKDEASKEYQNIAQNIRNLEKEIEEKVRNIKTQAKKLDNEIL